MEIGAVKQAFNNELILLKKNLNQAKTQIIHKLTRKAKQLTEKKAPDALKEKFKKKAENAVKEVLIMKKIKVRDIGKFIVVHTGKLQEFLNRPQVDNDKACARILLHKSMQEKYKLIRNRFSNIPIKDLFMSRNERLKLKKEEQMKKKEKRDRKRAKGVVNAEGDWNVEDVALKVDKIPKDDKTSNDDDDEDSEDQQMSDDGQEISDKEEGKESEKSVSESGSDEGSIDEASVEGFKIKLKGKNDEDNEIEDSDNKQSSDEDEDAEIDKTAKPSKNIKKNNRLISQKPASKNSQISVKSEDSKHSQTKTTTKNVQHKIKPIEKASKIKPGKKVKDKTKNNNLQDKIVRKKFKKDSDDIPEPECKVVDPFFVTVTGGNYMSIAEPRQPDEVKEEHKQGNRQLRRAVMFGHVPKIKPRQQFTQDDNRFDRQNGPNQCYGNNEKQNKFSRNHNNNLNKKSDDNNRFNNRFDNKIKARFNDKNDKDSKEEKLHPSWEAKKKQSGILPFQGKKIVFDET